MKSFIEFLEERALNIGDKSVSYPKFNNIMILAGGAGSGKGFASSRIINFEGKRFDVDEIKSNILKYKPKEIEKKFIKQTGRYLDSIKLTNPFDVSLLHQFVGDNKLDVKIIETFFTAQKNSKNKPNIIMDVTLKNIGKLEEIYNYAERGGYDTKNIHIVWIVNDFNVAVIQNQQRSRSVSSDIMIKTHTGAALTMKDIIENSNEYRKYADGDIWLLFNKANVDNIINKTKNSFIVEKYTAVQVKEKGKPAKKLSEIEQDVLDKINSYIPQDDEGKNKWIK